MSSNRLSLVHTFLCIQAVVNSRQVLSQTSHLVWHPPLSAYQGDPRLREWQHWEGDGEKSLEYEG
jgi:hypothetical protein